MRACVAKVRYDTPLYMESSVFSFGPFSIDAHSRVLMRDRERIQIPPKSADLLIALLERNGELVTRDELMTAVWPDTFVEDNNLAKHVFLLRKTLGNDGSGVPYIETVPKRGYRFTGHLTRAAAVPSPVYEYEDRSSEEIVIEEGYSYPKTRIAVAAACAVLLACVAAGVLFRMPAASPRQWRSVAVQPFRPAADTDPFLASALSDDVAARLRTIRDLRVVSTLSVVEPQQAGSRLAVETVLNGRVDLAGGRLQVAAQLLSVKDGSVIWAEQAAELDPRDVQAAVSRLASSIAARLRGTLLPAERARLESGGSVNREAYREYLHGRTEMLRNSANSSQRAIRHLETAVRLDPGFADGWAALARAQVAGYSYGVGGDSDLALAKQSATRALSIDPSATVARHALVRIHLFDGRFEDMLREARTVLEIARDDPEAQAAAAFAYRYSGMLDRAIPLYEKYVAVYADDEDASYQLVHACLFARQYERGIRHSQKLVSLDRLLFPTYLLYMNRGDFEMAARLARRAISRAGGASNYFAPLVLDAAGFHEEAKSEWRRGAEILEAQVAQSEFARWRVFLAMTYARLNRQDAAREQIRRAVGLNPDETGILFFASEAYALLNDRNAATDALRAAIAKGFLGLQFLEYYQQEPNGWARFRNDPEYRSMRAALESRIADLRSRY